MGVAVGAEGLDGSLFFEEIESTERSLLEHFICFC
jgi:hypothetical protein